MLRSIPFFDHLPVDSELWSKDILEQKHHWFYSKGSQKRCLLVPFDFKIAGGSDHAEHPKINKHFWRLGAVIVNQLKAKKVAAAEVVAATPLSHQVCCKIAASVELSKYSYKAFKETHNDLRVSFSIKND